LCLLQGEPIDTLSQKFGVEGYCLEGRERAFPAMNAGLKTRTNDPLQTELNEATRRIGELVMKNERLYPEREVHHPPDPGVVAVSRKTSPGGASAMVYCRSVRC